MHINEIRRRLLGKTLQYTFRGSDGSTTKRLRIEKIEKSKKFNGFLTINGTEEEARNSIEEIAEHGLFEFEIKISYRRIELVNDENEV